MKTPRILLRLFNFCPYWKRHVSTSWNFEEIKDLHWWCMDCPLKTMGNVGRAYQRTVEKMDKQEW